MPCFKPHRTVMDSDQVIHWDRDWRYVEHFDGDSIFNVPCRSCIGCNLALQREWSVRCFHEALQHTAHWRDLDSMITTLIPNSSVLTLTYDDDHLPSNSILVHDDFQRFMKRLRIRRQRHEPNPKPIRFYMCGEYGSPKFSSRPHYHSVIFGHTFDDRYETIDLKGQVTKHSYELDELWSQPAAPGLPPTQIGRASVDDFSFAGAAYVAGYLAKKAVTQGFNGPTAEHIDSDGVVTIRDLAPEYRKMSRHPGLGAGWLLKPGNLTAVYSEDAVRIHKWTFAPPSYYDQLLARHRPDLVDQVKLQRREGMDNTSAQWTPERCSAAELIAIQSLQAQRDSL